MDILCLVPTHFMQLDDLEWPGEIYYEQKGYNHFNVLIVDPDHPVDKHDVFNLPKLQLVCTASTGSNHIDLEALKKHNIDFLSLLDDRKGLNEIRASSEFTFWLILAALRVSSVMKGNIQDRNLLRGRELYGKDVGIIGLGRIGSNIFRWMKAFDANVKLTYDIPKVTGVRLADVFHSCDIIVVCCTLNSETEGMITGEHILMMKPNAVLVNTSRGEVLNEKEVAKALQIRKDVTLAADVLAGEHKGWHKNSPLIGMENTILTPHISGLTFESNEKAFRIINGLVWRWHEAQTHTHKILGSNQEHQAQHRAF